NCEVLTTLTPDTGRILSKLHTVQPKGKITFGTGIRVAHLALKHRQGKNHKMRIIAFVGSPVHDSDKDLVKLAKRLKKEKVNVDIINFGEEVRIPGIPTFHREFRGLSRLRVGAGKSWRVFLGTRSVLEDFGGFSKVNIPGKTPIPSLSLDPRSRFPAGNLLAVGSGVPSALSRHRGPTEPQTPPQPPRSRSPSPLSVPKSRQSDEALLKMTIGQPDFGRAGLPDLSSMSEEEQIAYAMQMSLQGAEFAQAEAAEVDSGAAMDTSEPAKEEDDYDVMQDPEFLQSVLENLPGVDPNNEAIRNAMGSLASQAAR
ncbi:PSMD4 ATPase, partial [Ploceus nigricollis]|nr:PSMD4 ATPase [Ploceus nigricollis]